METRGPIIRFGALEKILNLARANSLWPMTFGLACCAIEMMCAAASRFDLDRFGANVFRPSPRQADLMIVTGTITKKMAPAIVTLYEQMPSPKWVIAYGNCAISGGPFVFEGQYNIIEGVDKLIPVDVYVPGCPPRPEALYNAFLSLHAKWDRERIKDLRWYQKDWTDEGVPVPELGPDMVDWRVVGSALKTGEE